MKLNFLGLQKTSDKILSDLDKIDQLKKIANRGNHAYMVKKLYERLSNEYRFWLAKGPSGKLEDVEKDLKYIHSKLDKKEFDNSEKSRIVILTEKYPIN